MKLKIEAHKIVDKFGGELYIPFSIEWSPYEDLGGSHGIAIGFLIWKIWILWNPKEKEER
jgi:hypothetical protein